MILLFVLEVASFPGYLLSLKILNKHGELTANRFSLITVAYLSALIITASYAFITISAGRIIGSILAILCFFPGYLIVRLLYKRVFLP